MNYAKKKWNKNLTYQISEILAFDDAVKAVLDWINASPERKNHTLPIVATDHETGGFAINGPINILKSGEFVKTGWTAREAHR